MTAFTIETLLLLGIAFVVGLVLGLALVRRRAERRAAEPVSPLAAATLLGPEEQQAEATRPDLAPEAPRAPAPEPPSPPSTSAPAAQVARPQAREPDLFSRFMSTPLPELAHELDDGDGHPGRRPPVLAAPEGVGADDLKLLKGIGPQNERRLHALGIFHFRQIAAWTPEEALWVGSYLAFPGRIEREDWIGQAQAILDKGAPPDPKARRRH